MGSSSWLVFERLARVVETVGSSQVDERPASFNRFRGLDKEGRSFRLLAGGRLVGFLK